ncbi:hypothetical protein BH09BAC6_BH09BAC6_26350 [soil metagenome]|jgi:hypothetical protein
MRFLYKLVFTSVLLCFAFSVYSQNQQGLPGAGEKIKPDDKTNDGTAAFKVGVTFINNDVFMGRADTVRTPALIPAIKYTFASGIYFSGSLNIIANRKKNKLDGGDIAAGYEYELSDDLSGGVSVTKLFYNSKSTQIASSISSSFNANLTYDIGDIVSPSVNADYNIIKQAAANDIFLNVALTHDFNITGVFGGDDVLLISPTVTVNTGTENYYDAYLGRKNIKRVNRTPAQTAELTKFTAQLSRFQLQDYELSAPVEYKSGHFIFQLTPVYAIVKNQLPATIASRLSAKPSVFYFETGVAWKFGD